MYNDFPTKDRSKAAMRRKNHARKLKRARVVAHNFYSRMFNGTEEEVEEAIDRWARHNAENLKACSCYMCGNVRRWWNDRTLAEKKNLIAYQEQLNTLDSDE